jgi:hypothetical protein
MKPLLLLNTLGNPPQSFKRQQRWFCHTGSSFSGPCVISQTGSDRSVIAIRQANDEVGIWPSADANELHALAVQGMMWMGHRHPFQSWLVKGGNVL